MTEFEKWWEGEREGFPLKLAGEEMELVKAMCRVAWASALTVEIANILKAVKNDQH